MVRHGGSAMGGSGRATDTGAGGPWHPRETGWPLFSERRGRAAAGAPAVVFLHGLLASGRYWDRVVGHLGAAGLDCRLVDLLGFGRSPWPDIAYTLDDHLAALEEWRASAGLADAPLVLVGHSLGALLALQWAARTPTVRGAVLVSLPVYREAEEARRRLARLSTLHRLTLTSRPLAHAACTLMCATRPLARLFAPLFAPQVPTAVAQDGVLHIWPSLSGTLESCIFGTPFERVQRLVLSLPLVLIHGGADETAPVGIVRELARGLPHTRLVEVPGVGHDLPLSRPALVADAIATAVVGWGAGGRR